MGKKYLIYVDILGYKGKAEEISEKTGIQEDFCREIFLRNPLKKKMEDIGNNKAVSKGLSEIEGSDNYIIPVDTVEEVIEIIGELTRIKIPCEGFQWIPLEIGVGMKEINEDIPVELNSRTEIITFLKEDIINPYRDYFEQTYKKSAKESFVLFTEDFFNDLESLDRNHCTNISHREKSFFLANLKKIHERCSVFKFLSEIGYPGSKLYGRINDLYVPPVEYDDIRKSLKEKRIVFITGTREYGKTYTAVRLMWEYFSRGYKPKWVKGGEQTERTIVRETLENIEKELKPKSISYFEDPFGKTRYEKRESLEREIGTIVDSVEQVEDAFVIITSREEVFKEFEKEKLSRSDIKRFEKRLNLKRPSYNYKRRREILRKWAENESCVWFKDRYLRKLVFEIIEDEKILPTPLSIRSFAKSSIYVDKEKHIREKMKEKSEETTLGFSREIKEMSGDKILFLSFLFISNLFKTDFIREVYEELIEELNLTGDGDFDRILDWFKDDKINVGEYIEFSHPSYSEALKYLLVDDGYITRINKDIFSKLLFKLADREEAAKDVAWAIAGNFDALPNDVRNMLFQLVEKDEIAEVVAWNIVHNFKRLHQEIKDLLFKLAEKDEIAEAITWTITYNFDRLPENVRDILFKLADKEDTAKGIIPALEQNFGRLPENVKNELLLKLVVKGIITDVEQNFGRLPENVKNELLFQLPENVKNELLFQLPENVGNALLLRLAEKDETAGAVAEFVEQNFEMLPWRLWNIVLLRLAEKDETAGTVAGIIKQKINVLPEDVRNTLLLKLAEKDETAGAVAEFVEQNFEMLPEDVRKDLLTKLAKKDRSIEAVARIIVIHFNSHHDNMHSKIIPEFKRKSELNAELLTRNLSNFPEEIRSNILLKLAEKDETAGAVAEFVEQNFDNLSWNMRNILLLKLAGKDETAGAVARITVSHFSKLPEEIRNRILRKLVEKDETAGAVAEFVTRNYDKLPRNVRKNLFLRLAKKKCI